MAIALAAGGVLRFTPSTPMWLDEALSVNIAGEPLGEIGGRLRADGHPPLYYWLLHGWMRAFGDSAAAARALSGILGLAAIGLVWVLARRLAGPAAGRAAAVLMAVLPFAVRYSSEARMYSLVMVLVLAGALVLERMRHDPGPRWAVALGVISGLLLLSHYWTVFLLATVVLGLLWPLRRSPFAAGHRSRRRAAAAVLAGGTLFVPWLPAFLDQLRHTGTPWAEASRPTRVASESLIHVAGGLVPEAVLNGYLFVALVVLGAMARREEGRLVLTDPRGRLGGILGGVVVATLALGAAASWVTDSAFAGRYAATIVPVLVVLAAMGVTALGGRWLQVAALSAVVVLSGAASLHAIVRLDRTQVGQLASVITEHAAPGDLVVACPDQLGPALSRLLPVGGPELVSYPDLGDPRFVNWRDYLDRFAAASPEVVADTTLARAAGADVWLVWSGGYRVVGEDCDALAGALGSRRPGAQLLVAADGGRYFEHASLLRLPGPGS